MAPKFVEQQKCPVTLQLKIRFIAAKTLRHAIACHRAPYSPMTHLHQRMTLTLVAPCGNRIFIRESIWKSELELSNALTLSLSLYVRTCVCVFVFSSSFSRLVVSFKDEEFSAFIRVERYTWNDILSNVGGLCSLFVGASLLSVMELLYYLTFRIFFTCRQRKDPENESDDNDQNRVIYVSPATLQSLSNRSHTLDQTRPLTFVQRIR